MQVEMIWPTFREYKRERLPAIIDRNRISQTNSTLLSKAMLSHKYRILKIIAISKQYIFLLDLPRKGCMYILNSLPKWIIEKAAYDNVRCRPQVSFLRLVEDGGKVKASPQPSLHKTLDILKRREKATAVVVVTNPVAVL